MDKGYRKHHNSLADHKQPGYDTHSGRQSRAGGSVAQEIAGRVAQAIAKQDRENRAEARKKPPTEGGISRREATSARRRRRKGRQADAHTHVQAVGQHIPRSQKLSGVFSQTPLLSRV